MEAAFTKLKGFIHTYSGFGITNFAENEEQEIEDFITGVSQQIRWEMEDGFSNCKDDTEKLDYVKTIQLQLTYLADGVTGFKSDPEYFQTLPKIIKSALLCLFKLLEHIRKYFLMFFDADTSMPLQYIQYCNTANPLFQSNFSEILTELKVDQELHTLIISFSEATGNSDGFKIRTWRQWDYLLHMMSLVSEFIKSPSAGDVNLELLKLFIRQDFNSIQIYGYFLKYLEKTTLIDTSFQEQQEHFIYLLKIFRQVRVNESFVYDKKVHSLKVSVLESLNAEIIYLEQKEKLYLQNFKSTSEEAPSKFYFSVAVTLAELMFFFRVMLEVGVIQTKFNSYLYEFVANHIRTQRTDNISKKSMRNHFSNKPFPDRLVKNVKGWLDKMVTHIDLYYKTV